MDCGVHRFGWGSLVRVGDRLDACSVRPARAEGVVPVAGAGAAGAGRTDAWRRGTRGREQEQCIDCGRGLAVLNAVDWDGEGGRRRRTGAEVVNGVGAACQRVRTFASDSGEIIAL